MELAAPPISAENRATLLDLTTVAFGRDERAELKKDELNTAGCTTLTKDAACFTLDDIAKIVQPEMPAKMMEVDGQPEYSKDGGTRYGIWCDMTG